MPLRAQLKSVKLLLEETPVTPENAPGLIERLAELDARIAQQPQLSAVRPATIAIRNLIVSLRRPDLSSGLADELVAAIDALSELLADATFGIESDDVRARIAAALRRHNAHACSVCKYAELAIDSVYLIMRPFPSDPALAPVQLPAASVVCKRCGAMRMHDLAVLGEL
jgi:hypothetical protein